MFLYIRIYELLPHLFIWTSFISFSLLIGLFVLKLLNIKSLSIGTFSTAIIVGYTLISFYYFIIGMLQLYREPLLTYIPLALFFVLLVLSVRKLLWFYQAVFANRKLVSILSLLFLYLILFKVFPDIGFDSNWYHLSQPLYYLKHCGIYHVGGYIFSSGYPQFTEMLFVPLLHFGDSTTTSLFSVFNYFLLLLVVFEFVLYLSKNFKYAYIAALIVMSTPVIFKYSGFAYVDILQGLCLLLAFFWLNRFLNNKNWNYLLLSGAMLVPVSSIKYSGGLLCIPLAAFLMLHKSDFFLKIKTLFVLIALPLLGLIPWLIRNKLEVNNFLEPMGKIKMLHYGSNAATYSEYIKNINWLNSLSTLTTGELMDYFVPAAVLLILVLCLLKRRFDYFVFTFLSIVIYRSMPPGDHYRFYIPFISLITVMFFGLSSQVGNLSLRKIVHILIFLILFFQISYVVKESLPLTSYAFGLKDSSEFKAKFFLEEPFIFYDLTGVVRREVGNQKLIVKGVDLIYPTLTDFNVEDYSFAQINRFEVTSYKTLREQMIKNDYKYILVNRDNLSKHFEMWFKETDQDKINDNFDLIAQDMNNLGREWFLYKIKF